MHVRNGAQTITWVLFLLVLPLIASCGGLNGSQQIVRPGLSCVDDSPNCIGRRKAALNELINRTDRGWVKDRPSAHAYASGVRLFAFRKKKSQLTCDELKHGHQEARSAPAVLGSVGGKELTSGQIARGKMLAAEVSRDLSREIKRRCG